MTLRTLYLQEVLSIGGRHSLIGRQLYDEFRRISEECLLGHIVLPSEETSKFSDPQLQKDVISYDLFKRLDPNLVYLEGGLFANHKGLWRIPRPLAEELVTAGAVIIVADADVNELRHHKPHYEEASTFLKASANYGVRDDPDPVYGADQTSFWRGHRQIVCKPEKMIISEWLRPVYGDISEILVGLPVRLLDWEHIVASCNSDSTGILQGDLWVDRLDGCPFASAARVGLGYVAFIAGNVSDDVWLERCPDNVKWLTNLAQFLLEETSQDRNRYESHLRSLHLLFLSHRSVNKAVVEEIASEIKRRGVAIWFDKEKLVPSDSLVAEIDRGLEQMTHFVLFWSADCVGAPWVERELRAATARLVERNVPILIIRLDDTPAPAILADLYRIEGGDMSPQEIGKAVVDAVDRLAKREGT
jgi:hypothetical protein